MANIRHLYFLFSIIVITFSSESNSGESDTWKGKWFPTIPGSKDFTPTISTYSNEEMTFDLNQKNETGNWKGKWFPTVPQGKMFDLSEKEESGDLENWKGKWFPKTPGPENENLVSQGICDNGETNLHIDFSPKNILHSLYYNCYESKIFYEPNYEIEPILMKYEVPEAYVSMTKCMNETISYDLRIPTFGTHRYIGPKFGEYVFVPPQRWLQTVEFGGLVALYHPCGNKQQISKLKSLVKNCLYRHIISASDQLTNDRPFAIIAYSHSLEMSVIDDEIVINFIRKYALKRPHTIPSSENYSLELIASAEIVSAQNDEKLCPKNIF